MASLIAQRCLSFETAPIRKRLFLGFVAGFASHVLLDAFPHQEYGIEGVKLATVLFFEISLVFLFLLSPRYSLMTNAVIFLGIVGGAIPDFGYRVFKCFLNGPQSKDLATIIHLFSHEAIPLGLEISIYFQSLLTLTAIIFIRTRLAK